MGNAQEAVNALMKRGLHVQGLMGPQGWPVNRSNQKVDWSIRLATMSFPSYRPRRS
jgi:hypothetical protein